MVEASFRRGKQPVNPFEAVLLPDAEKERLCRELLSEFGVTHIRHGNKGELIHSCCLPEFEEGGKARHRNGDSSPSASLNYEKLTYNCQGCGSSGGFLWWIATCRGDDTDEARKWLEDQTGGGSDEQSLSSLLAFFDAVYSAKERNVTPPLPRMSTSVLKPWLAIHPYLTDPPSEGGRGITEQSVMRFNVGYAPKYRIKVGETDDTPPKPIYQASQRIVIPHFWKGDLVGWQTRRLLKDGTPKYVSSPDFPKDTTIFNYDPARPVAVVVESPMSTLVCADDVPQMEATFGAKVTDKQCRLLSMHRKVVLWMDNDDAGWNATERIAEAIESYSDVWIVNSPWAEDAGDLPSDERLRLLADPVPYSLWTPPRVLHTYGLAA